MQKPRVLLVNPTRDRAAVYVGANRLLRDEASAELLEFGLRRGGKTVMWRDDMDLGPRPRPSWVPQGSLQGWMLIWLRDGTSTAEHLRAMPDE